VVVKDFWIDSDRMREGDILDSMRAAAVGDEKYLFDTYFLTKLCHGDVRTESGTLDDTAEGLMRGLDITSGQVSLFELQRSPIQGSEPPPGSEGLRALSGDQDQAQDQGPPPRYAHKTHYRIVFKERCIPIDHIKSLPDVITILSETVNGAFWYGTVHL
jgi:hypothetical protein